MGATRTPLPTLVGHMEDDFVHQLALALIQKVILALVGQGAELRFGHQVVDLVANGPRRVDDITGFIDILSVVIGTPIGGLFNPTTLLFK